MDYVKNSRNEYLYLRPRDLVALSNLARVALITGVEMGLIIHNNEIMCQFRYSDIEGDDVMESLSFGDIDSERDFELMHLAAETCSGMSAREFRDDLSDLASHLFRGGLFSHC